MTTGEKLLARLSLHFEQDPLIDEIGLLFGIEQSDVTPDTAFCLENHKLGVAFTAGVSLFQAARTKFHLLNVLLQQEAVEMTQSEDNGRRAQLLHCTRAILLISADFYTAWNTRKSFVTRGWLDAQDEVQFTNLVFALHPKSIDTWAYRRWLAIRLCQSLSEDELRTFYEQQIEVSSRLAEVKPRNYHAWSYRHWIVFRLPLDLTLKELNTMECWCKTHVTDHSGWNHRQHILNELAKKYQDAGGVAGSWQNLILAEFKFLSEVMATYPTYEALWCHRRYVMQCLLKQMSRRANSDLSLVLVLISQVTGTLLDTKLDFFDAAALELSWGETMKVLSSGSFEMPFVVHAIVREIETGWRCGNQFSRHYAAWCLARLRTFFRGRHTGVNGQDEALGYKLSSLASTLHKQSVQKDRELEHLLHCTL